MIRMLIADDDMVSRRMVEHAVARMGIQVFTADDGDSALKIMREQGIHMAILDWMMPRISGIRLCRLIRGETEADYRYIILCTARNQPEDIVKGLSAGADDYITKPYNIRELEARIKIGKRILNLQHKLLSVQDELRSIAVHDGLTGLLNRREISRILEERCIQSQREQRPLGVIMLDIDHFKAINDRLGHPAGDAVLQEAARRIRTCLRPYDKVGRYGGEEFLLILPGCDHERTRKIAERVRRSISASPIDAGDGKPAITASLGCMVAGPGEGVTPAAALRRSDAALYRAKAKGRDRVEMAAVEIFHQGGFHEREKTEVDALQRSAGEGGGR